MDSQARLREFAGNFVHNPPVVTILPRNASGKPGQPYEASEPIVAHVTKAIRICQTMVLHPKVLMAFDAIDSMYFHQNGRTPCSEGPNGTKLDKVTSTFMSCIIRTFPLVFVDYTLNNPDSKGFHTRRPWDGDFEPRHQSISINGKVDEPKSTF